MNTSDFHNKYCLKCLVLSELTSSKNERIAFSVIWAQTIGRMKRSVVILNEEFEKAGIAGRKSINLAVNRLKIKGLVFKFRELIHNYDFDVYIHTVNLKGVVTYLEGAK